MAEHRDQPRRLADNGVTGLQRPFVDELARAKAANFLVGGEDELQRRRRRPRRSLQGGGDECFRIGGATSEQLSLALLGPQRAGPVAVERHAVGVSDQRQAAGLAAARGDQVGLGNARRVGPRLPPRAEAEHGPVQRAEERVAGGQRGERAPGQHAVRDIARVPVGHG